MLCLEQGCSVNHNGTKVVWKEAWPRGMEVDNKEMEGMTPLMLAIQFLRGYSAHLTVLELLMSDNSTGNRVLSHFQTFIS